MISLPGGGFSYIEMAINTSEKFIMKYSYWLWPVIIVVSAIAVSLVTTSHIFPSLRPLIAFWYLLVCPGMAIVRLFQLKNGVAEWTLAIALSLTLDTLVAGIMLYSRSWSPFRGLVILIGISLVGAVLQIMMAFRRTVLGRRVPFDLKQPGTQENKAGSPLAQRR